MINAIQEYVTYLVEERRCSHNTVVAYERDLKKAAAFFEERKVDDLLQVTETNLQSYLLYMERSGMSAATVSRSVASLRSFYQYMLRQHRIASDPSLRLSPPHVEKKAPEVLTDAEAQRLFAQPNQQTVKGRRDYIMLLVLYKTGIRVSELVHLLEGDVNWDVGYIVCMDKDRQRVVPLEPDTAAELKRYCAEVRNALLRGKKSDYLFINCAGRPMSRQGYWKILKTYAEAADIQKDITPHTLRHSFAARQLQQGTDLHRLQQMLGHSDLSTTHLYAGMLSESKL